MTTPTGTPDLSQFSADPNHNTGMDAPGAAVTSGVNMAAGVAPAPVAVPPAQVAPAPQVFVPPVQAAPAPREDERIARLEKRIREQDEASEAAALQSKFNLPSDATDKFEEGTLEMMQKSALYALSTADGISLIESVVRKLVPQMLKGIEQATETAGPAPAPATAQAPNLDNIFVQNFQMTWDQIKMLPSYSGYMAQIHQGRPVFEWVKQFADQGDMTNVLAFIGPLVDAARATQPPAPHAPVGTSPGFVPAPAVGADDSADPNNMQFSEQKLAPLLKKASRGGWASLTADEQYILSTADQAASEGRVAQ